MRPKHSTRNSGGGLIRTGRHPICRPRGAETHLRSGKTMQNAIDGDRPAAPKPAPGAHVRRGIARWLLVGVGAAAGLFVMLTLVIAAGSLSEPSVADVGGRQAAPVRSIESAPAAVEPTVLPSWIGRRQSGWGPDGTKTISFALDAVAYVPVAMSR